jgi:hypothetical protein
MDPYICCAGGKNQYKYIDSDNAIGCTPWRPQT